MYSQVVALRVPAQFLPFALAQLIRLLLVAEVSVDGHMISLWVSGIAVLFAGGLSVWMGELSYRSAK
jgi:hypothetical protein